MVVERRQVVLARLIFVFFITAHARAQGTSLWDAISSIVDDRTLSTRSQSALVVFRNLIQELSVVASTSAPASPAARRSWPSSRGE